MGSRVSYPYYKSHGGAVRARPGARADAAASRELQRRAARGIRVCFPVTGRRIGSLRQAAGGARRRVEAAAAEPRGVGWRLQ
ncbi:hypothetical protein ON010_g16693 [Phytophthora cinnamomi]|nr:hypothetical protein ON010_g16693 [Phytophthora cinnamomi]